MATLTREEIIQALERLGELAHQQGYSIELLLMGGAAMVLMYNARPSTRDVDVHILCEELKARYAFLDLWEAIYGPH
jgi:hypothetical protein